MARVGLGRLDLYEESESSREGAWASNIIGRGRESKIFMPRALSLYPSPSAERKRIISRQCSARW